MSEHHTPPLTYEFGYVGTVQPPSDVGPSPTGHRQIFNVTGGTVTGDRIRGVIQPGGGDWLLVGADGFARTDVRASIETHDGAILYMTYHGYLELTEGVTTALASGESGTDFADHYFRTSPRLETGDERYAWVNHTLFVGVGRVLPELSIEYQVFRVG